MEFLALPAEWFSTGPGLDPACECLLGFFFSPVFSVSTLSFHQFRTILTTLVALHLHQMTGLYFSSSSVYIISQRSHTS